jgi:carbonic anhydrase
MLVISCKQPGSDTQTKTDSATISIPASDILTGQVLTAEQRNALTPARVLDTLKAGNADFVNDELTVRNNSARVREAALGQSPKAVVLSCLDSRVPVEDVFHCGIGDLFVARVAGNITNEDINGSLEFACRVTGSKVILVLGHEYCGAIKSAIDNVQLGNITALLAKIRPAVDSLSNFSGEKKSSNNDFVHAVCEKNIKLTMETIRRQSPLLKEMEAKGEIRIVGAVYNMTTGKVMFLE